MNHEWISMLEKCVRENGGKIEGYAPRTITIPCEGDQLPFCARNAVKELELEWDYKVVIKA